MTGTGPAEPSVSSVLTQPGLVEAGWQVELVLRREDLGPGWSRSTSSDAPAGWSPAPPVTAVGMWRDRSATDLKGVDRVRAAQLVDHRIYTIGELLDLDEDGIARVVTATRASRVSRTAATGLFDLLAAWSTALDRAALGSVTLAELRVAARPG